MALGPRLLPNVATTLTNLRLYWIRLLARPERVTIILVKWPLAISSKIQTQILFQFNNKITVNHWIDRLIIIFIHHLDILKCTVVQGKLEETYLFFSSSFLVHQL